jgi:hypothetical protein
VVFATSPCIEVSTSRLSGTPVHATALVSTSKDDIKNVRVSGPGLDGGDVVMPLLSLADLRQLAAGLTELVAVIELARG